MTLRTIEVMGTVVTLDVRRPAVDAGRTEQAFDAVERWLRSVDETFSTYRPDSPVSRLRRGEIALADCDPDVATVLGLCADATTRTDGYFSAMADGQLDPTGLVKGWAAQRGVELLRAAGLTDFAVNAGGDVACAGEPEPGKPWRVGVADPHRRGSLVTVVSVRDAAVATSAVNERGLHVLDPHTGRPATTVASVTVVGPDLTEADAYATAGLAGPSPVLAWLDRAPGYEALTVAADGSLWWSPGFPAVADGLSER